MNNVTPDELKKVYIHTYDEILSKITRRLKDLEISYPSKKLKQGISRKKAVYIAKLNLVYNIVYSEVNHVIDSLKKIADMHEFYRELFKVRTGYSPEQLIKLFNRKLFILKKIFREHIAPLKTTDNILEARTHYRAGIGRLLSVVKRHRRVLELISSAVRELSKMPSISEDEVKVIVAGMPQVGKSTLISKLSTAKPEIAPYPFTTKTIIVGHMQINRFKRIAFIDTPGLLDRPLEERNEIELKAILALRYLADKVIFLIDVSPNAYYTFEEQLRVLIDVKKTINAPLIICINKIDITPPNRISEAKKILSEKINVKVEDIIEISAYKNIGLDKIVDKVISDP